MGICKTRKQKDLEKGGKLATSISGALVEHNYKADSNRSRESLCVSRKSPGSQSLYSSITRGWFKANLGQPQLYAIYYNYTIIFQFSLHWWGLENDKRGGWLLKLLQWFYRAVTRRIELQSLVSFLFTR